MWQNEDMCESVRMDKRGDNQTNKSIKMMKRLGGGDKETDIVFFCQKGVLCFTPLRRRASVFCVYSFERRATDLLLLVKENLLMIIPFCLEKVFI